MARIKIGEADEAFDVPNWTGFVGQWDDRIWDPATKGEEQKLPPIGLRPGFIKRTPVAWYATHHNTPTGDAYYEFSYLFQFSYDLPGNAKTITLPDDPNIRLFAVTLSREPPAAPAAAPLYDTLTDHMPGGAPLIPQAGQTFHETTQITLLHPLYFLPCDLHYTLDGSDPTAGSPVYTGPFYAEDTVNIAARQIDASGKTGPIVRGTVTIHDTTPPQLVDILANRDGKAVDLTFSKPVAPASAANLRNYSIQPPISIEDAIASRKARM